MKLLKFVIALLLVLLLQTMVIPKNYWLSMIDLFLLFNIYFALNFDQASCMMISISSGLVQDAFSKGIIGMNAFSKTIVAFLISTLSSRLMIKHPLIIMLLIVVATCIDLLLLYGLMRLFRQPVDVLTYQEILMSSLFNSVTGLVGFQIADRIRTKKDYV